MKSLVKHIQNMNAQKQMWQSDNIIIVGVSGGPDSICLVDVLRKIADKSNLIIIMAHVNYGLRGNDSASDEQLVKKYAKKHSIICETLVCEDISGGSENSWREIRYAFFKKVCAKHGAIKVAVAHTKNDQAETVLCHLLRGSGLQGLSGMQYYSKNNIIRPLLGVTRNDVLEYCAKYNIAYNIDKTNEDTSFMRNRVRKDLIPELAKLYNPQIIDILATTAMIVADDQDFLKNTKDEFWHVKNDKTNITFSAKEFLSKHISVQRRTLRTIIDKLCGSLVNIESNFIEELRKMISSTKNKHKIIYTKDLKMMKNDDTVEFVKLKTEDK